MRSNCKVYIRATDADAHKAYAPFLFAHNKSQLRFCARLAKCIQLLDSPAVCKYSSDQFSVISKYTCASDDAAGRHFAVLACSARKRFLCQFSRGTSFLTWSDFIIARDPQQTLDKSSFCILPCNKTNSKILRCIVHRPNLFNIECIIINNNLHMLCFYGWCALYAPPKLRLWFICLWSVRLCTGIFDNRLQQQQRQRQHNVLSQRKALSQPKHSNCNRIVQVS